MARVRRKEGTVEVIRRNEAAGGASEKVRALMDAKERGPVTIIQAERMANPSTERYATSNIVFAGRVAVSWCSGDEHTFDARTGACIESSDGRMKGWRIAPWEMYRFNAVDAQKYLDAREAGGMSVGDAAHGGYRVMHEGKDVTGPLAIAAAVGGGVELGEQKDIRQEARNTQSDKDKPAAGIVLVLVPEIFSADEISAATASMLKRVGVSNECTHIVCYIGSRIPPGFRFEVVVTTDDAFGWFGSDNSTIKWWRQDVAPRRTPHSIVEFVSLHSVIADLRSTSHA